MADWNADDVVLTVWGAAEINGGSDRDAVLDELERDTGRSRSALTAAIKAVTTRSMQADVLRLLLQPLDGVSLIDNRRLLNQLARAIRSRSSKK